MPHLLVYAALPTGLTAGSRVEFLTLCTPVGILKPIIGRAIGVPHPLHVYLDGRELDDGFTGLLDGTTIIVSTVTPRHARLSALGCSVWPAGLQQALEDANAALDAGLPPRLAKEGEGATYFLVARDPARGYVACFKPQDEEAGAPRNPRRSVGLLGEPSMRSGILSGEGFVREVAAFLLDHEGFAGVPPTALVVGRHPAFNNGRDGVDTAPLVEKIGAFQQFIADGIIVEEFGSCARLPDEEVWKVALLDLRLFNLDRNGENVLVRFVTDDGGRRATLVPIDHGACLPSDLGVSSFVSRSDVVDDITPCMPQCSILNCRIGSGTTGRSSRDL